MHSYSDLRKRLPQPTKRHVAWWLAGAVIFLGILTMTTQTSADSRLRLKGEILIESGILNNGQMQGISPRLIVRTAEGGYVVAGKSGWPWAGKVGPSGKTQWRYKNSLPGLEDGEYSGAALQADDSVLLSANVDIRDGDERRGGVLITHLDKAGQLLSEKLLSPQPADRYAIINCKLVRTSNGAILFSHVSRTGDAAGRIETLTWVVTLSSTGQVLKEAMLGQDILGEGPIVSVRQDEAGDIILMRYHVSDVPDGRQSEARQIFRLGADLAVRAQTIVKGALTEAEPDSPQSKLHLISQGGRELNVFALHSKSLTVRTGPAAVNLLGTNKAFMLADGSFLLLGRQTQRNLVITAAAAWYSSDLKRTEALILEPPGASFEIADAVPTGQPGEYAFVRGVTPSTRMLGHNETRSGAIIQFMQTK
ncbi:hypothetical protein MJ904_22070 [Massilia sp. MB5]|uniref:hypothetical protein n=1 Tax=Massilia sp. MB5 TaxID=2919578 RepID=UPI001F0D2869|nr:hypothetical protein [Massilia sp. MB5]UMR29700.1 hypothetical protein MJ904_22070 [Massilia sp. MB5]